MGTELLTRLRLYINTKGIKEQELVDKLGMKQPTLNGKLNGKRSFSIEELINIAFCYNDISMEWLMRGEGSMFRTAANTVNIDVSSNKIGDVTNSGQLNIGNGNSIVTPAELESLKAKVEEQKKTISEKDKQITKLQGTIEQQQNTISRLVEKL